MTDDGRGAPSGGPSGAPGSSQASDGGSGTDAPEDPGGRATRHTEAAPEPAGRPDHTVRRPRDLRTGNTPAPGDVPYPLVLAAGWSWRLIVVLLAGAALIIGLRAVSVVVVPLAVALLLTSLLMPVVRVLRVRARFPNALATATAVIGFLLVVAGAIAFAGTQIASGTSRMLDQAKSGLDKIVDWLHTGPLHLSDQQLKDYTTKIRQAVSSGNGNSWLNRGSEWAGTAGHFLAGILIAVFATFFFLSQGERIAVFLISLLPRPAQGPTFQAGRRGWVSLTSYVRVQILVAAVDAVGIGIGAAALRLPFTVALALLVFICSFVPIVGAIASGAVAVLVALVTHGPVSALVMLGVVIAVQQVESHVLQPFLMGRAVSLHPLAVVLAVVVGSTLMGIVGALFAVPLLAVANSMIRYYHGYDPFPSLGTGPLPAAGRPTGPGSSPGPASAGTGAEVAEG